MFTPKLIALDLDGTLFTRTGEITPYTREQIRAAADKGIAVVLSTGRPYAGLPLAEAVELGIEYAITANGAAIYHIPDKACLREEGISPELAADILLHLPTKHLHLDAFIHGEAYTQSSSLHIVRHSNTLPESVKNYILTTRRQVEDLAAYVAEQHLTLQKATINFEQETDGTFIGREEVKAYLEGRPEIQLASGGYFNLEFTRTGITKADGLKFLCDFLQIPLEHSMACGDSGNDLDILKAAGLSVAMANAEEEVKAVCDYITASCNEDGVGKAIAKFI